MKIQPSANPQIRLPAGSDGAAKRQAAAALAEDRVFAPVSRGRNHAEALRLLDSHTPPLLGAFEVKADPLHPAKVRVASERLDHLEGMVTSFGEAARNLRDENVLAAVADIKGSAEASTYGAALGAACVKGRLDAAAWITAVSIIAQNHVHGPMLQRQVARGRLTADDPRVVNWQKQKQQQPFYDQVATATEAFDTDDVLQKAPAWSSWQFERIAEIPDPLL